jgi:hypothetical protein
MWILKGKSQAQGDSFYEIVTKIPADEALDRTCAEKGYV